MNNFYTQESPYTIDLSPFEGLDDLPELPELDLPEVDLQEIELPTVVESEPMVVDTPKMEIPEPTASSIEESEPTLPVTPKEPVRASREPVKDPSFGEVMEAAFEQENVLVNLWDWATEEDFEPVEGYEVPKDILSIYSKYASAFKDSQSPQETQSIVDGIEEELHNKEVLEAAGWGGIGAQVAAAIADPTILVGGALFKGIQMTARGGKALAAIGTTKTRTALAVGVGTGLESAATESVLHMNQDTRTLEESALNVGLSAVAGGALVPITAGVGHLYKLGSTKYSDLAAKWEDDLARTVTGKPDYNPLLDGTKLADSKFVSIGGKISQALTPSMRMATSELNETRTAGALLLEDNFLRNSDLTGDITLQSAAETSIKARLSVDSATLITEYDKGFKAYYKELKASDMPTPSKKDAKSLFSEQLNLYLKTQSGEYVENNLLAEPFAKAVKDTGDLLSKQLNVYSKDLEDIRIASAVKGYDRTLGELDARITTAREELEIYKNVPDTELVTLPDGTSTITSQYRDMQETIIEKANKKLERTTERRDRRIADIRGEADTNIPNYSQWDTQKLRTNRTAFRELLYGKVGKPINELYNDVMGIVDDGSIVFEMDKLSADELLDRIRNSTKTGSVEIDRMLSDLSDDELLDLFAPSIKEFNQKFDRLVDDAIDRIAMGGYDYGDGILRDTGVRSVARMFNMDYRELQPFTVTDTFRAIDSFTKEVIPRIEVSKRFGDTEMTDALNDIRTKYAELKEAAKDDSDKYKELIDRESKDITSITEARDMLLGRHRYQQVSDTTLAEAGRVGTTLVQSTYLSGVIWSSIPDMLMPILRSGLPTVLKTLSKSALNQLSHSLTKTGKVNLRSKTEREAIQALGLSLDTVISRRTNNLTGINSVAGNRIAYLSTATDTLQDNFGKVSGMDLWTDVMQEYAAKVSMNHIGRIAKRVSAGKALSKDDKMYISALRLSKAELKKMHKLQTEYGSISMDSWTGNIIFEVNKWKGEGASALANKVRDAVIKDVDSTILNPSVGDVPYFMKSQAGKALLQFKSFVTAAQSRLTYTSLQRLKHAPTQSAIKMAAFVTSYWAAGMAMDYVKHVTNQIGKSDEDIKPFEVDPEKYFASEAIAIPMFGLLSAAGPLAGIGSTQYSTLDKALMPPVIGYGKDIGLTVSGTVRATAYGLVGLFTGDMGEAAKEITSAGRAASRLAPYTKAIGISQGYNTILSLLGGDEPSYEVDTSIDLK